MPTMTPRAPSDNTLRRRFNLALLDSNPGMLEYLRSIAGNRYSVARFTKVADLFSKPSPDLLLLDWYSLPDPLALLAEVRTTKPDLPVVMLACSADLKAVVQAIHLGARDVILKPFGAAEIDQAIRQHVGDAPEVPVDERSHEIPLDENLSFVHCSKRMNEIESQCRLVARADIPVMVLGESGSGKEVVAIYIHQMSARSHRNFLKVNCAAIPADLLESELFGYEQGAFTGASKSKPGKFEMCNHGTIFLDEIGEMPAALQAKLLQVLQDGTCARLGSRSNTTMDVRVIAATNIDIKAAIAKRTFREDLYYRLDGFTLRLPPLRERREEIPVLARYFMRKISERYGQKALPLSSNLMQAFMAHSWPGNLRELENTIKRYIVLNDEQAIISEWAPTHTTEWTTGDNVAGNGLKRLVRNLKDDAESVAISQVLEVNGWNRKAAANSLQISYKALLYKIKQYNLHPQLRL
jgi:two-component system, NtrC family, response regulator AtoC